MNPQPESNTRLRGRWLTIARVMWLALAALTLSVIVAAIGPRAQQLATVSSAANTLLGQPTPADARALE